MKKSAMIFTGICMVALLTGCGGQKRYYQSMEEVSAKAEYMVIDTYAEIANSTMNNILELIISDKELNTSLLNEEFSGFERIDFTKAEGCLKDKLFTMREKYQMATVVIVIEMTDSIYLNSLNQDKKESKYDLKRAKTCLEWVLTHNFVNTNKIHEKISRINKLLA